MVDTHEGHQIVSVNSPQPLIEMAINKNLDIDKLDRLLDLQQKWEAREAVKSFNAAMSEFQANCPVITMNVTKEITMRNGGKREMRYSDLANTSQTIKDSLHKAGLSYRYETQQANQMMTVTCIVSHKDGHKESTSMSSVYDTSGDKNTIQSVGSTKKYLMRYTLEAALGIVASSDDDGELSEVGQASESKQEPKQQKRPPETKWMPTSMFDKHKEAWKKQIKSGDSSITSLGRYIDDRGYKMTEAQFNEMNRDTQ